MDGAGLTALLHQLPEGMQTPLGEGGALVSGGEGQRVRIGRALARSGVRLAILDEPARGLERIERKRVLDTLRTQAGDATLFAITHDISDTLDFDRVLVIDRGRIVEDGPPRELADTPGSRYRAMLGEQRAVQRELWSHPAWRRLRMSKGTLSETRARVSASQSAGPEDSHPAEEQEWTPV